MIHKKPWIIVIGVLIIVLFLSMLFTVKEGEKALLLQLGKIKSDAGVAAEYSPGLHFKFPFVNTVKLFDARIQGFTSGTFSSLTSKQTFLEVDYFVKWRINNLALYYKRTSGSALRAEQLMEPKINDIVRAEFGKRTSNEIISSQRDDIMARVLKEARKKIEGEYGIEIIDVRIQTVKLPDRVMSSVFKRMASERQQFANNKRAEGMKVAESIKAKADQEVVVIKAKAQQEAAEVRAKGEKQAAQIYADAYGKDEKFYAFYRSLLAYQQSFANKDDILVLSPGNHFFDFFDRAQTTSKSATS